MSQLITFAFIKLLCYDDFIKTLFTLLTICSLIAKDVPDYYLTGAFRAFNECKFAITYNVDGKDGKKLTVKPGQITKMEEEVGAIVNAANEQLQGEGGVSGAIFNAAGPKKLQNACNKIGFCRTGSAVVTPAFDLEKVKWIIHAVAPKDEPVAKKVELLKSCIKDIFDLAAKHGSESIAIPCLGSGIFLQKSKDWNIPIICNIIASEVADRLRESSKVKQVYLMCFPGAIEFNETYDSYKNALDRNLSLTRDLAI